MSVLTRQAPYVRGLNNALGTKPTTPAPAIRWDHVPNARPQNLPLASQTRQRFLELQATGGYLLEDLATTSLRQLARDKAGVNMLSPAVDGSERSVLIDKLRSQFDAQVSLEQARGESGYIRVVDRHLSAVFEAREAGTLAQEVAESVEGIAALPPHAVSLGEMAQLDLYGQFLDSMDSDSLRDRCERVEEQLEAAARNAEQEGLPYPAAKDPPISDQGRREFLIAFEVAPAVIDALHSGWHRRMVDKAVHQQIPVAAKALEHYPDLLSAVAAPDLVYGEPSDERARFAQITKNHVTTVVADPAFAYKRAYEQQGYFAVDNQTGDPLVIRKRSGDHYFVVNKRSESGIPIDQVQKLPETQVSSISPGMRHTCIVGDGYSAIKDLYNLFGKGCVQKRIAELMIDRDLDVGALSADQIERIVNYVRIEMSRSAIARGISQQRVNLVENYQEQDYDRALKVAQRLFRLEPIREPLSPSSPSRSGQGLAD